MNQSGFLPRRTFLKGMATSMALPWLEAMGPQTALASPAANATPIRLAFVFFPNGAIPAAWNPTGQDNDYELSETLKPLREHKEDFLVLSGLTQDNGRAKGDGAGDHARSASTYLTGTHPYKTAGANIKAGVSVDQAAAKMIGYQTKLPSLELGLEPGRTAGSCDSGYSCAYSSSISWKTPNTPMAKEIDPRLVFDRLFGSDAASAEDKAKRDFYRKSILDVVAEDAKYLKIQLGKTDRNKIDEYFTSVRELEQRIDRIELIEQKPLPQNIKAPEGVPRDLQEHMRLMYDLMVLAFQTNSTRISTFMIGNAGSNRAFKNVGVQEGWHSLSHHRKVEEKIKHLKAIDKYLASEFGYFLKKMKSVKEGERTLLDNSMIVYGSGLGDGNRHTHHDLPIVLAGRGGGSISPGRHLVYDKDTPLNNLFLSLLDRVGAKVEAIGDSSGRLKHLDR